MKLRDIWLAASIVLLLVLAIAWIDGGREEQRMIVEPVAVPELSR